MDNPWDAKFSPDGNTKDSGNARNTEGLLVEEVLEARKRQASRKAGAKPPTKHRKRLAGRRGKRQLAPRKTKPPPLPATTSHICDVLAAL